MKTLGIVGGLGPESTIEYYRLLIAGYRERRSDGGAPSLLINSIDAGKVVALAAAQETALRSLSISLRVCFLWHGLALTLLY